MGKSTNFTGQPVLSQLLKLIDKQKILDLSRKMGCERYVKSLGGYTHLVVMLFGVLKHFDSLRELEIGMLTEANKLQHIGIDYMVRRSTLAEANKRRSQEFFANVYSMLFQQYGSFLADSRPRKEQKKWERLLFMMDSTTISLFDNILKGVGRHPKSRKRSKSSHGNALCSRCSYGCSTDIRSQARPLSAQRGLFTPKRHSCHGSCLYRLCTIPTIDRRGRLLCYKN